MISNAKLRSKRISSRFAQVLWVLAVSRFASYRAYYTVMAVTQRAAAPKAGQPAAPKAGQPVAPSAAEEAVAEMQLQRLLPPQKWQPLAAAAEIAVTAVAATLAAATAKIAAAAARAAAEPDSEPFHRQPVAPAEERRLPDSASLESVLAGKDTLQTLGGLSRNDRLKRAWLSGSALKSWYFGEEKQATDVPAPPAKTTVWGYVAQGEPVFWARRKAVYSLEARSHAGPRVDFEFCSQAELRAFCMGISYDLVPIEIIAS